MRTGNGLVGRSRGHEDARLLRDNRPRPSRGSQTVSTTAALIRRSMRRQTTLIGATVYGPTSYIDQNAAPAWYRR